MKRIVYLGDEDVMISFLKSDKSVIYQNKEIYVVDRSSYPYAPDPYCTVEQTPEKKEED